MTGTGKAQVSQGYVKGSVILRTITLSREINVGSVFNRFKAELIHFNHE
jgi:hypothetical protein